MARQKKPRDVSASGRSRKIMIGLVIGVLAVLVVADGVIAKVYSGKIYSGVSVGDERVGSLSYDEALKRVSERMGVIENEGLTLQYGKEKILLEFTLADTSGLGLAIDVIEYDAAGSAVAAMALGRQGPWIRSAFERLRSVVFPTRLQPKFELNQDYLARALTAVLKKYERPAREPGFELRAQGSVAVTPPKSGEVFDRAVITAAVRDRLTRLKDDPIAIALQKDEPTATAADAERVKPGVEALVKDGILTLHIGEKTLTVKPTTYIEWLRPVKDRRGKVTLGVGEETVMSYLKEVEPEVTTPPKEAKFSLKNGKVAEFQVSRAGTEFDLAAGLEAIAKAVREGSSEVTLTVKTVQPQAAGDNVSNLGIVELVGVGRTNFSGSPTNRRYNIKIGTDLLNGLLIKPGEEFSLIKAVGPVDATLGYKQELVIKEDRTIPEFGGGLCQIGTTFFRLLLDAGLPILERKNHSYRVRYYEPPVGMDATIYEPKPDLRFKNDYASYLLLQTRIEGDDLIFEFWGKKDGRKAATTTPRVFNVVAAPPQLTIETTDLKPGETKCTEKAHVGSDAEFTYTVTYPDGERKEQVFKSHYKPWRAVCYVGVKSGEAGSAGEIRPKENGTDEKKNDTSANGNQNANANENANVNVNTNTDTGVNANVNANTNVNATVNSNTNSSP